jgi:HPt (histidine-containing phosphotransfer) domain-containing protein
MNAQPPLPGTEPAQLDAQALARLRELDPDGRHGVLERVLQTYDTSLQRLLAQAADALARGDPAAVGIAAHTLKSSSSSVGALELSRLCAELERSVRAGETQHLTVQVENLLSEGRRVLGAVRAMLRS